MNFAYELDNFILEAFDNFLNEDYILKDDSKLLGCVGFNHVVHVVVTPISIMTTAYTADIVEEEYFYLVYIKQEKKIVGYGHYHPFLKHMENLIILDALDAI